jgi:hypothetical protein
MLGDAETFCELLKAGVSGAGKKAAQPAPQPTAQPTAQPAGKGNGGGKGKNRKSRPGGRH